MNTLMLLFFSVPLFILILKAETSADQFTRQKFALGYLAFMIIGIVAENIFIKGKIESVVFIYSLALLGSLPSFLISRLINYSKNKEKVIVFKLVIQSKGYFIFLMVMWMVLIYVNIFLREDIMRIEYDNFAEYFIYTYRYSLLALVIITFLSFYTFQTIRIYEEGLFFDGFLWKWSDFHSYSIEVMAKNKKISKVTLNLAKKIWIPINDIFLSIPTENGEKLDTWLHQKLPRA